MKRRSAEPRVRGRASRARLRRFPLLGATVLTLAFAFSQVACTKAPERPPESPLKQAKKDSRLDPQEEQDLERRHLAPPPAYGNKVVMAAGNGKPTADF